MLWLSSLSGLFFLSPFVSSPGKGGSCKVTPGLYDYVAVKGIQWVGLLCNRSRSPSRRQTPLFLGNYTSKGRRKPKKCWLGTISSQVIARARIIVAVFPYGLVVDVVKWNLTMSEVYDGTMAGEALQLCRTVTTISSRNAFDAF